MQKTTHATLDFIKTLPGFQYSVNLRYDYENTEKISNYLLTSGAIDIIRELVRSTDPLSSDRAKLLIGPYGKGKSHLVLILLAMLSHKNIETFRTLLESIQIIDKTLHDEVQSLIMSDKKYLPVVISGNSLDLTQEFLRALKESLKDAGLEDVIPDTYYNAATKMIDYWAKNYLQTYKLFEEKIGESPELIKAKLSNYDKSAYKIFTEVYPLVTSGSQFQPLEGIDLAKLFLDVSSKISSKGFKGIYVVYDEFSKFLEGSIDNNSAMDIKQLQDFAEMCNRSNDSQVHIMLISHKTIVSYVDRLPKEKVNSWKAVGDRYKAIEIKNTPENTYELIGKVIKKDIDVWNKYLNRYEPEMAALASNAGRSGLFKDNLVEDMIQKCYPLHPSSVYILPRVSEKVAQNERTLFTFLSTTEMNTLGSYLYHAKEGFDTLTPDMIYDYFEKLFKKESYDSDIYKIWRKATIALSHLRDDEQIEQKIIKTIAIIYIVNETNKFNPNIETVIFALKSKDSDEKIIKNGIDKLTNNKIIYYYKGKENLDFIESSGRNVDQEIQDAIEKRKGSFKKKSVLNECIDENYIYPTKYNDEFEITRFFNIDFISFNELQETKNWDKKVNQANADGMVYAVLLEEDKYNEALEIFKSINHNRCVFAIVNKIFNIDSLLREYDAIQYLLNNNSENQKDKLFEEELQIYLDDVYEQLKQYILSYIRPEIGLCEYYYCGQKREEIKRKALLSRLLSEICESVYCNMPVIVNEMVNKNQLSAQAAQSRKKVVEGLLKNKLQPRLGLVGYGQDVSIMQSTLIGIGILNEEEDKVYLTFENIQPKLLNVINIIQDFIINTGTTGKSPFSELYNILTNTEYAIGMRRGIIPIYIAAVLYKYKKYAVIYRSGAEMEINANLLERINEHPDDYEICIENWNEEKEEYIRSLEEIFRDYVIENEKEYNTFEYITKAIYRWFLQLPRYTKDFEVDKGQISLGSVKLRNLLKSSAINPRELMFNKVFEFYGYQAFTCEVLNDIAVFKQYFDNSLTCLIEQIIEEIIKVFATNDKQTVIGAVKEWYDLLQDKTKINLFSTGEDRILDLIKNTTNDEHEFTKTIAKILVGIRIEDWNNKSFEIFAEKLENMKKLIEDFDLNLYNKDKEDIEESYSIVFSTATGDKMTKNFEKMELEGMAKIAYDDMFNTINEEYGSALSLNQKRQIILKLLEKLC